MASSDTPTGAATKKALEVTPARQPLPLSATQEAQVREIYHKRVRNKCADEVRGNRLSYPSFLSLALFIYTNHCHGTAREREGKERETIS